MPASKYKLERKCEMCGETFLAKTLYSRFCSERCKTAAYRAKKKEKKKEQQHQEIVAQIPQDRPYISIAEAVHLFGVSRDTIYRLIRSGRIPAINLGERLTRVSRDHIESMFPVVETTVKEKPTPKPANNYKFDSSDSYTIGEVSKVYGISDSTVYKAIRRMSIPICQKGRFVYVPKVEIDKVFNPQKYSQS